MSLPQSDSVYPLQDSLNFLQLLGSRQVWDISKEDMFPHPLQLHSISITLYLMLWKAATLDKIQNYMIGTVVFRKSVKFSRNWLFHVYQPWQIRLDLQMAVLFPPTAFFTSTRLTGICLKAWVGESKLPVPGNRSKTSWKKHQYAKLITPETCNS